jgi:DNA-binding transcriptional MocR family regulator
MPEGVHWTRPQGGLFIWAILPENLNAVDILPDAVEERVAFVPGTSFYDDGSGQNTMRLNFSNAPPEKIEEGISRLGNVIRRALERQRELTALRSPT